MAGWHVVVVVGGAAGRGKWAVDGCILCEWNVKEYSDRWAGPRSQEVLCAYQTIWSSSKKSGSKGSNLVRL